MLSDEFEANSGVSRFNAPRPEQVNLAYNTKYDKDFAYDDANIDFLTFEGEPTTNRTGTRTYADEDSYIYEKSPPIVWNKINVWSIQLSDEEAWEIRTQPDLLCHFG